MNNDHLRRDLHLPPTMIAYYALGKCSPEEQARVDEHCFACEECLAQLAILQRVCAADGSEDELRQLEQLFPLGAEAIAQARHQSVEIEWNAMHTFKQPREITSSPAVTRRWRISDLWSKWGHMPRYAFAGIAVVAVISGLIHYGALQRSPVNNGLAALQRSYHSSRPLESRVTGGFSYQPYVATRGVRGANNSPGSPTANADGIDHDQLKYALVELTRAVASHPTAEGRHALGRLYLMENKFDEAENELRLALKESPRNAKLLTDLASLYYERSKYEEPLPLLSKAIGRYKEALDIEPELHEAWFNRALCYEQMALFTEAQKSWERYLQLDPKSEWATEAREHLKRLQSRANQTPSQIKETQMAFKDAAQAGDDETLRQLLAQHFVVVKAVASDEMFSEYLATALKGDSANANQRLDALKRIGRAITQTKGDRYIEDLVEFASRASPAVLEGMQNVRSMLRRADGEFNRGSLDAAYQLYTTARQTAEGIGDKNHAELTSLKLVRYYNLQPDTEALASIGDLLLTETESRKHRQLHAESLLALASAFAGSQQISRSLEYSLKAAKIANEIGDTYTAITGLSYSGGNYARMGDYERAISKNFEAVSLLNQYSISNIKAIQAYAQLGDTLFRTGDYLRALDYQNEALLLAKQTNNSMLTTGITSRLGLIHWKNGNNDHAIRYLNEAMTRAQTIADTTSRSLLQIELQTTIADYYLQQNKVSDAISSYKQAINTIGNSNNRVYLAAIHQGLASAYLAKGNLAEAESQFRTSISLAERDREQINDAYGRSAFFASRQNVYHSMIEFQFITKRNPELAFDYSEIAKSRELLEAMTGRNNLNWSDGRITLQLSGKAHPLSIADLQRSLPVEAQVLAYASAERRLMIWLITRDNVYSATVDVGADKLRQMVADYREGLNVNQSIDLLNSRSFELYNALISPVASKLDHSRSLCIIPDGMLARLPFAALLSPDNNRYLVEDFVITVNPSASVLAYTLSLVRNKRKDRAESFLGIGNPRFNYQRFRGLPALRWAGDEINNSAEQYQHSQIYSREKATESAVIDNIGGFDIVHLATHVLVNDQSPLQSQIVLTEESGKNSTDKFSFDGSLHAFEIYRLKLRRTRLIILSGCRSALGSQTRGESLGALAQAFIAAGAPNVIASLWEIEDQSSSELMQSFHYYHRSKKMSFGESLRQAQIALIRSENSKWRHPYHWAAFLMTGNGLPAV
jgi:CHAT domain-containing protein